MVNAVLLYLNTQTPKMPCLAILGNTIRLRALHILFWGRIGIDSFSVLMKPTKFLTLWCIPHDAERI
jgi:hypothetical protein